MIRKDRFYSFIICINCGTSATASLPYNDRAKAGVCTDCWKYKKKHGELPGPPHPWRVWYRDEEAPLKDDNYDELQAEGYRHNGIKEMENYGE